jgi:hypothetical protein
MNPMEFIPSQQGSGEFEIVFRDPLLNSLTIKGCTFRDEPMIAFSINHDKEMLLSQEQGENLLFLIEIFVQSGKLP